MGNKTRFFTCFINTADKNNYAILIFSSQSELLLQYGWYKEDKSGDLVLRRIMVKNTLFKQINTQVNCILELIVSCKLKRDLV